MQEQGPSYRYERKFIAKHQSFQVEQIIKGHPALFSEIFHERRINNIYFDTPQYSFLFDNVVGSLNRKKYRIRWYGNDFDKIEKPVLEIKIKNGFPGYKRSFPLKPFNISMDLIRIKEIFSDSDLPDDVRNELVFLQAKLFNSYTRKYFLSGDKRFRMTIDDNLSYHKPESRTKQMNGKNHPIVVEMKYEIAEDQDARRISQELPYRFTKHSKYENGIACIYPYLNI